MANVTMHKTYTFGMLHNNKPGVSFLQAPLASVVGTLITWQDRLSARANLRDADAYMLQDMGISVKEAREEAAKPFWIN